VHCWQVSPWALSPELPPAELREPRAVPGRGVEISQLIVDGHPDQRLPAIAADIGADLIAVGTHEASVFHADPSWPRKSQRAPGLAAAKEVSADEAATERVTLPPLAELAVPPEGDGDNENPACGCV